MSLIRVTRYCIIRNEIRRNGGFKVKRINFGAQIHNERNCFE